MEGYLLPMEEPLMVDGVVASWEHFVQLIKCLTIELAAAHRYLGENVL